MNNPNLSRDERKAMQAAIHQLRQDPIAKLSDERVTELCRWLDSLERSSESPRTIKLTIDRARWACGGKNGEPMLLNRDGNMCCLGFLGAVCGIPLEEMDGRGSPADVRKYADRYPQDIRPDQFADSDFASILMDFNDSPNLPNSGREQSITEMMSSVNVSVEFIGEYPKEKSDE